MQTNVGDTMNAFDDYYRILQVHYDASQEVINAAYKRLSSIYHPDVNTSLQSLELMKKINSAYETLKDNSKRKKYHSIWLGNNKNYDICLCILLRPFN